MSDILITFKTDRANVIPMTEKGKGWMTEHVKGWSPKFQYHKVPRDCIEEFILEMKAAGLDIESPI